MVQELLDYLLQFDEKGSISLIIVDPDDDMRKRYPVKNVYPLQKEEGMQEPCFIVCVAKPENLDEFVAGKDGQLGFLQV